jgi:hypothetical protein
LNEAAGAVQRLATEYILTTSTVNGAFTLAQVLKPVLPSTKQQLTLLQGFANREGTVEEFWSNLRQNNDFQEQDKVEKIQFQLQLNVLTQNNLLLINAMQNKFQSTQEMARLDQEELKAFIKQGASDSPANNPGDAKEAKLDLVKISIRIDIYHESLISQKNCRKIEVVMVILTHFIMG